MYNYIDIGMNDDGDLMLSPPKLDINGDPVLINGKEVKDMQIVANQAALAQEIDFRLRCEIGDLYLHPTLGGSLKPLIGMKNTQETAEFGKTILLQAFTYGNFISAGDISIISIPADTNTIIYQIEIYSEGISIYKFSILCDLENGIRRI